MVSESTSLRGAGTMYLGSCFCAILCLGIAAFLAYHHAAYFTDVESAPFVDTHHYLLIGHNVLRHGEFSRSTKPPFVPDSLRTPVYPLFIGALNALGGGWAIYGVQVLLQITSCGLLYLLVGRLFGPKAALWASALFGCDVALAINAFVPMTECLFLFLLLLALQLTLPTGAELAEKSQWPWWRTVAGGVVLGLTILTRPAALYLPLVIAASILVWGLRRKRFWRTLCLAVLFLVTAWTPVAGWILRNAVVCGFPRLTSVEGTELAYSTAAGVYQVRYGISLNQARARIAEEYHITPHREAMNAHCSNRPIAQIDAENRARSSARREGAWRRPCSASPARR